MWVPGRGRWQNGERVLPCRASWATPVGQAHLGDLSGPETDPDLLKPRSGGSAGQRPQGSCQERRLRGKSDQAPKSGEMKRVLSMQ